jgi:hypothetical protein
MSFYLEHLLSVFLDTQRYACLLSTLDQGFDGVMIVQYGRLGSLHASALGTDTCQPIAFITVHDWLLSLTNFRFVDRD